MRLVLEHAPPHQKTRDEVGGMLEMEHALGFPQRRIVDPRQMPEHVVPDPERKRDRGMGERSNGPTTHDRRRECRRDASTTSRGAHSASTTFWRRCTVRRKCIPSVWIGVTLTASEERHRAAEGRDAPGSDAAYAPYRERRTRPSARDDEKRLRIPRPRVRIHSATLDGRGCSSVGRAPAFQAGCRRFEPGRPL